MMLKDDITKYKKTAKIKKKGLITSGSVLMEDVIWQWQQGSEVHGKRFESIRQYWPGKEFC